MVPALIAALIAGIAGAAGSATAAGVSKANSDAALSEEEKRQKRMLDRLDSVKQAQFSKEKYNPEQFNPELYGTPEAAKYQEAKVDPRLRDYQLAALQSLQGQYNGAADAEQAAARYAAMNDANQMAAGREGAILQNAQARGMAGSGMEFGLRQIASQEGANRAQAGTLEAARMAALQKLAGQQAYMQGMGQFRGQEFQQEANNADIINRFNMANTQANNAASQGNVQMKNNAGLAYNQARNAAQSGNIDRGDRVAQARFANRMTQATGGQAANPGSLGPQLAANSANTQAAMQGIGGAVNMAGGAISGYMSDQEREKRRAAGYP